MIVIRFPVNQDQIRLDVAVGIDVTDIYVVFRLLQKAEPASQGYQIDGGVVNNCKSVYLREFYENLKAKKGSGKAVIATA